MDCLREELSAVSEGREHMRVIERFDNLKAEEVLTSDALNFLLTYSGGHTRYLMMFVQEACAYAEFPNLAPSGATSRATDRPLVQYVHSRSALEKVGWLDFSPNKAIPNGDDDYLAMLENLSVLEYINGGEENSPFALAEPWYAVNPIVRELQKFKSTWGRSRLD